MHEKIGRNDPCPCSSGKKYKHCCLGAQSPSLDYLWRRQREASDQLTKNLMRFAAQRLGNCLEEVWRDFNLDEVPEFLERDDSRKLEDQIFMPYFLFQWRPDSDADHESAGTQGGLVAEGYLREKANDPMERLLLQQGMTQPISFYEVLWSDPGERVTVRDLLLGGETEVLERLGSRSMRPGHILYAQIWNLPGLAIFGRLASHVIPPSCKAEILSLRNSLRLSLDEGEQLTASRLREFEEEIRAAYLEIRDSLYRRPQLCNSDGDPILFHTLTFQAQPAAAAFDALAPLAQHASREELLADAKLDESGNVCEVEFDWVRLGKNQVMKTWDNTILGHIRIAGNSLVAEVNSERRAARLRKEIEKRLGSSAIHESTSTRTPDEEKKRTEPRSPAGPAKDELLNDPEVRAQLQAMVQQQTEAWVHQKLPILGGRTPMQAVRDPDGREIVESLLLDWETREYGTDKHSIKPDLSVLRKRLKLPRAASEPRSREAMQLPLTLSS